MSIRERITAIARSTGVAPGLLQADGLLAGAMNTGTTIAATFTKRAVCHTSLMALGVAFGPVSRFIPEMKQELAAWKEGIKITVGVLPDGPYITVQKRGNALEYLGARMDEPDVAILFKNLDSALMVFTGQAGSAQAVAENRICVYGSNHDGMAMTRAMAIAQTYLFPGFVVQKTFKRPPRLGPAQLVRKGRVMAALVAAMPAAVLK